MDEQTDMQREINLTIHSNWTASGEHSARTVLIHCAGSSSKCGYTLIQADKADDGQWVPKKHLSISVSR